MSTDLVNLSFKEKNLSPSEKHILTILCFRADAITFKCWPSTKSLMHDSGYCRDTVTRGLASLKEKFKILDTGERKGKTKSIIVYEILIHKLTDGKSSKKEKLTDCALKMTGGQTAKLTDGQTWKDQLYKDQRKERFFNSQGPVIIKDVLENLRKPKCSEN